MREGPPCWLLAALIAASTATAAGTSFTGPVGGYSDNTGELAVTIVPGGVPGQIGATVVATANILGAGHAAPPPAVGAPGTEGTLPTPVFFSGISYLEVTSVIGAVSCGGPCGLGNGADGGSYAEFTAAGGTDITSPGNGLSGLQFFGRQMFLVGVFLDSSSGEPAGSGPARLSYTDSSADGAAFSPLPGQVFFIGDGQGGSGTQAFFVPSGADSLYLGFLEAASPVTATTTSTTSTSTGASTSSTTSTTAPLCRTPRCILIEQALGSDACAATTVPAGIRRKLTRAVRLFEKADEASPRRAGVLRARADRRLRSAAVAADKAEGRGKLSQACAGTIVEAIGRLSG